MLKTILFQTIQFGKRSQISWIWPIDRTLSGASTLGPSGTDSNGNEEVLHIPQCSVITGATPLDCLVSYPGHAFREETYPSVEMQSYSTITTDWARNWK